MACKNVEGNLTAMGKRFAVISGRFNALFSERLMNGAVDAILRHGGSESDITIIKVPGCFEIPLACIEAANSGRFDAIVATGVLIEGETDHYDIIATQVASGVAEVTRTSRLPVTFGVITAKSMEQAAARSGSKCGNLGYEAALAAIEMVQVVETIRGLR